MNDLRGAPINHIVHNTGLEIILRGNTERPRRTRKGSVLVTGTFNPKEHLLKLPLLNPKQALVSTARHVDSWLDSRFDQDEEGQLQKLAAYVRQYYTGKESPKMRVSRFPKRGLIFEISFPSAPYTLITPPIARKYQRAFAEVFWAVDEMFRYFNIDGENLINRYDNRQS